MRAIHNLLNSLYRLTGIGLFRSMASAIYKVERTQYQVKQVKQDASRVQGAAKDKKKDAS